MLKKDVKIAIIGGGVAGATTAIKLGQLGMSVTLFEKESSLVSGPPFCHLHAGGNLYREISDAQCVTLLKQSIDFLRFYPYVVDYRPTVIALPTTDKSTPKALLPRLELLVKEYELLIQKEPKNRVLGESSDYYKVYEKEELEALQKLPTSKLPKSADEWMIPVAKNLDLEKVQFPLILVQEYGLNLFRLASGAMLTLKELPTITLRMATLVNDIEHHENKWKITSTNENQDTKSETFDYIINAAGFRVGKIDDMIDAPCKRMVEFKAAYIAHSTDYETTLFPEIIIHGERGTPQGMGQFTPYPNGYIQLHGMTTNITLYEDGLVSNTALSCQPKLGSDFMKKLEISWSTEEVAKRTNAAIEHLSQFIPSFSNATVGSKPLFGAQQIPGDDPTLRVAEVSFPAKNYARCEIVKVSSAIDMTASIIKKLGKLNYLDSSMTTQNELAKISEEELQNYAETLAVSRDYPSSLANRNVIEKSN